MTTVNDSDIKVVTREASITLKTLKGELNSFLNRIKAVNLRLSHLPAEIDEAVKANDPTKEQYLVDQQDSFKAELDRLYQE